MVKMRCDCSCLTNFNKSGFRVNVALVIALALLGISIVSCLFLISNRVSADEPSSTAHATATITVPEACTFSGTVNTPHRAEVPAGTYVTDIGSTTFKVVCNDSNGYSIYAIGYTGKREKNNSNNVLDATIGGTLTPAYNIASGTATSGNTSNWAMKLTPVTGTYAPTITNSYDNYNTVPLTSTKVAQFTSVTDAGNNATGSSFTATYSAYVSGGQPAGTYDGKVKYIMVHPATNVPNEPKNCSANRICYWPNAGNQVNDSMADQTKNYNENTNNITSNMEVNLWPSNFKRQGHGFAGWSDAYDYVVNEGSASNPNAHIYGPMETINVGDVSSKGLSLYAVWVPSEGNLQSWNGCSTLTQGKVTALTDTRDNDTYAVAKLADSKCWMIENLRLDYDANGNSDGSLAQGYGGTPGTYGTFSGLANPETANFSNSTTANSRYTSDGTNSTYNDTTNPVTLTDIGTTNYPGYRMPRYNNNNTNTDTTLNPNTNVANMTTTDQNVYGYGNYYTWHSAIANTNYYNTTTVDSNGFTPSEAANTSLCPKGWRLPYGRNTGKGAAAGGFSYLDIQLGGTGANQTSTTGTTQSKVWRSYPNNFLYSGSFDSSSPNSRSYNGYYWSSTANGYNTSYYLYLYSTYLYPGTVSHNKYYGRSIRCITDV